MIIKEFNNDNIGGFQLLNFDLDIAIIPKEYQNNRFSGRFIGVNGVSHWFNSFKIIKK